MKVRDVMTKQLAFCGPDTNLTQAVELMWKNACGFLPVDGEGGNAIGVITDRDISIALGTRDRRASEVCVRSAVSSRPFACMPDDDVHTALKTLKSEGIRRLPVVDGDGMLMGVLSIDDAVLNASVDAPRNDISYRDIDNTYRAILLYSSLDENRLRTAASIIEQNSYHLKTNYGKG